MLNVHTPCYTMLAHNATDLFPPTCMVHPPAWKTPAHLHGIGLAEPHGDQAPWQSNTSSPQRETASSPRQFRNINAVNEATAV